VANAANAEKVDGDVSDTRGWMEAQVKSPPQGELPVSLSNQMIMPILF
jgi:hypothetical protein